METRKETGQGIFVVRRYQILISMMVVVVVLGVYLVNKFTSPAYPAITADPSVYSDSHLPELGEVADVATKKATFFGFLLPLVQTENHRILSIRLQLESFATLDDLNDTQLQWLTSVAQHYRIDELPGEHQQLIFALLRRVDTVPPSLALAQSANESAWGGSRFAQKGNNLFGQWCFTKGCGIVPASRDKGAFHEVAVFENPGKSVESYIHNLNSNIAYKEFRRIRALQRGQQLIFSGEVLAEGLLKYSARGTEYIRELRAMIKTNKLGQYDNSHD